MKIQVVRRVVASPNVEQVGKVLSDQAFNGYDSLFHALDMHGVPVTSDMREMVMDAEEMNFICRHPIRIDGIVERTEVEYSISVHTEH